MKTIQQIRQDKRNRRAEWEAHEQVVAQKKSGFTKVFVLLLAAGLGVAGMDMMSNGDFGGMLIVVLGIVSLVFGL